MSKRPVSTGISCPGCTTNFDVGAHSPLIGSCAHSLCSTCVNEKKTRKCPVCSSPGGFLWNQKNELATELLAILNGKGAKKPRLEAPKESENPVEVTCAPENGSPPNVTQDTRKSAISKDTFEDLVRQCAHSNEDIDWNLGCRKFHFDVYSIFKKVLPFDHEGRVSKKRPLAFVKENEPYHFYILRKDGKVVLCTKSVKGLAQFVMLDPKDYPPCLQTNS